LKRIPPLYSSENEPDPLVVCKFFTPDAGWTWYVIEGGACREPETGTDAKERPLTEYDPELDDVLFFGYVAGSYPELGYFTLAELEQVRGRFGMPVERDRLFTPCRLSEVREKHGRQ